MDKYEKNCLPYKYDAFCKTEIMKSEKYTFVWRISDFSSRPEKNKEVLNSEDFTIKGPDEKFTKWCAEIYPKGYTNESSDYISVYLQKKTIEVEVNAFYTLYCLDANNIKQKLGSMTLNKWEAKSEETWGWAETICIKDLSRFLQDDDLTLFFEITIVGETKKSIEFVHCEERSLALTDNYHQRQLSQDFETHFLSKEHSDIIIRCGDKLYDCHKFILTSRSPVFKSMIESDMKEKISGEVEIKNMDHDVLEDLLKYIYSGVAPKVDKLTQGLLTAADQYHLEQLKELCELKLCSRLDISNCIELLILGDLHNAQKLKAKALEFVSKNMQKMKPSEWKQSFIAHPALMAEVMERVLPKNDDEEDTAEIKKRTAS